MNEKLKRNLLEFVNDYTLMNRMTKEDQQTLDHIISFYDFLTYGPDKIRAKTD